MQIDKNCPEKASIPINFCGKQLPPEAYWLELITCICPDISEQINDWTLDLHYCSGTVRTEKAQNIIQYCAVLSNVLSVENARISGELQKRLPEYDSARLIDCFQESLFQMTAIAHTVTSCVRWRPMTNREVTNARPMLLSLLSEFALKDQEFISESIIRKIKIASDEDCFAMLKELLSKMST